CASLIAAAGTGYYGFDSW
nr:immunoglobulin heavy chain junction region [Macaca mulatta]